MYVIIVILLCFNHIKYSNIKNNSLTKIAKIHENTLYNIDIDNKKNILFLNDNYIKILPAITKSNISSFKEHEDSKYSDIPQLIIEPIISFKTKISFHNILYWNDEKDNTLFLEAILFKNIFPKFQQIPDRIMQSVAV